MFTVAGVVFLSTSRPDVPTLDGIFLRDLPVGSGGGESAYSHLGEFIDADVPSRGKQLTVWSGLPTNTAYVTYTHDHRRVAWQRPVDGTVDFSAPLVGIPVVPGPCRGR